MEYRTYNVGNHSSPYMVQDLVGNHAFPCCFYRLYHFRLPLLLDAEEHGGKTGARAQRQGASRRNQTDEDALLHQYFP